MNAPRRNSFIFNIAGSAILAVVVSYMGYSALKSNTVEPCTARYPAGKQFALENENGQPLTAIELQGRAGLREWGILKNAKIIRNGGAQSPAVLQVNLARLGEDGDSNGVGFIWNAPTARAEPSACLSYHVAFPKGFAFKEPGHLPGLFGVADLAEVDDFAPTSGFATRIGWGGAGDVGLEVRQPGSPGFWRGSFKRQRWPTGRWVTVEQEVVLNAPGQKNGVIRLWVDGELRVESKDLVLASEKSAGIGGVVADIRYANTASEPGLLHISPFVLQRQ